MSSVDLLAGEATDRRKGLPAGTQVDDYVVGELIRTDGFALTYRAHSKDLARDFLLREFFPLLTAGVGETSREAIPCDGNAGWHYLLKRFSEEASLFARLRHPGIGSIMNHFEANNTAYSLLENVEGPSLESWLSGLGRRPTQAELDALVPAILDSIDTLHREGVVHCGVHADSFLLRSNQTPVIVDLFTAVDRTQKQDFHVSIVRIGASALEQYGNDASRIGPWTDVYALGALLYGALTGVLPPSSTDRHAKGAWLHPASEISGNYRPSFLATIDRMLALEPSQRPVSVADVRGPLLMPMMES